jgi:ribosome-associated protein
LGKPVIGSARLAGDFLDESRHQSRYAEEQNRPIRLAWAAYPLSVGRLVCLVLNLDGQARMNDYDEYEEIGEDVEYYAIRPNKTQIKKEIAELFALAETMSKLSAAHLNSLELPENIHKAVSEVTGMPHTGARKRLLKYIAAQLHKMDVSPVQEKLARIQSKSAHAVREHHITEQWRDKLIHEGNDALTELFDEQPAADLQQIRQLLRNIKKETETSKPPRSSRLLYRYLKDLFLFETDADLDEEQESDL